MCRDGRWKRFAPTSITGAWDGAPSTLAAPPVTGFTGTISGRERRKPMASPGNRASIKSLRQEERAGGPWHDPHIMNLNLYK